MKKAALSLAMTAMLFAAVGTTAFAVQIEVSPVSTTSTIEASGPDLLTVNTRTTIRLYLPELAPESHRTVSPPPPAQQTPKPPPNVPPGLRGYNPSPQPAPEYHPARTETPYLPGSIAPPPRQARLSAMPPAAPPPDRVAAAPPTPAPTPAPATPKATMTEESAKMTAAVDRIAAATERIAGSTSAISGDIRWIGITAVLILITVLIIGVVIQGGFKRLDRLNSHTFEMTRIGGEMLRRALEREPAPSPHPDPGPPTPEPPAPNQEPPAPPPAGPAMNG